MIHHTDNEKLDSLVKSEAKSEIDDLLVSQSQEEGEGSTRGDLKLWVACVIIPLIWVFFWLFDIFKG